MRDPATKVRRTRISGRRPLAVEDGHARKATRQSIPMKDVTEQATDARRIPGGEVLETDVCIVGAGPAGISISLELARQGVRVLLLEAGGRAVDGAAIRSARAESVGHSYFPIHSTRAFGFGGTTSLWIPGMFRAAPLSDLDFEARKEIPFSGWPIDKRVLAPFYERAVGLCGIGGPDFSPRRWASSERPALALPTDRVKTEVFQSADVGIWRNRYREVTRTTGLRLLLHARVVGIEAEGDEVRFLRVASRRGTEFRIKPRVTVLAAGGLENPRLLLLSRDQHPNGLGNGHDVVGRYFQEHLALRGGIIRFSDPARFDRMGLYQMHRHPSGARVQGKILVAEEVLRRKGLLGCAFFVQQLSPARVTAPSRSAAVLWRAFRYRPAPPELGAHAAAVLKNLGQVARATAAHIAGERQPHTLQLLSEAEQSPNPDSRVTLSTRWRDELGLPKASVDWRVTELDRRSIVESQRIIDRALRASGLGWLERRVGEEPLPVPFVGHWHHMGTTRMHDDPRMGVVDRNCRVHGIRNLFVAGSSVFPTSGYANPTYTIVALALRLAEHVAEALPRL